MSGCGYKRKSGPGQTTSALPLTADIRAPMSAFRQYMSGLPSEADVHHGIRESLLLTLSGPLVA